MGRQAATLRGLNPNETYIGGAETAVGSSAGRIEPPAVKGQLTPLQIVIQRAEENANNVESSGSPSARTGKLGKQSTRDQIVDIAGKLKQHGWQIVGGGGELPEEYLPGPRGRRRGSSYPDITATKDGNTLRVNTIDTRADGVTPSTREANNAARIRSQKPDDTVILVPKPK